MRRLQLTWAVVFGIGVIMVAIDSIAAPLIAIKNVPALGVVGAALILLAVSSILNWIFKIAWDERSNRNGTP